MSDTSERLSLLHQFTVSPTVHKDSLSFTSSLTLAISCLFGNSHSDRCEVISHCGCDLHSCLENPRDGGAWWAAIYGVAQS